MHEVEHLFDPNGQLELGSAIERRRRRRLSRPHFPVSGIEHQALINTQVALSSNVVPARLAGAAFLFVLLLVCHFD